MSFFENQALPLGLHGYRIHVECPEEFIPLFVSLNEERTVVETFTKADPETSGKHLPIVGTTHLTNKYTLGSVNRAMLWRQRRAVLGYWGTPENPTYMHMRFLKNHYDYCSAHVAAIQHRNDLLAAVTFATDGGDTHPNLDMLKNATIEAEDLRLRFEFGADVSNLELPEKWSSGLPIQISDRDIAVSLYLLTASFNGKKTHVDISHGEIKPIWILFCIAAQKKLSTFQK